MSQMSKALNEGAGNYTKAAQGLRSISGQLSLMQGLFFAWKGAEKLTGGASGMIRMADEYGQMASRIKMVTADTAEYELVQRRLLETANQTYRPLEEAQEVYIRTSDALKSLGYNTQQALDVSDSLSYLFVTNAASGDRAASAMDAFSKALQTGRVDAMAWRTILAAVPSVVDAIALATGKTKEEIRKLGAEGTLALTDLTEGLRQSLAANQKAAADMPTTVADAFTALRNALQVYLGEANEATGATGLMVAALETLKDNLDTVANLMKAGAAGGAAYLVGKLAILTNTTLQNTAAAIKSALANHQKAAAEREAAAATLVAARADVTAAEAALVKARAIGTQVLQKLAAKRATEQLTLAKNALLAAETRVTAAASGFGVAMRGLLSMLNPVSLAIMAAGAALVYFSKSSDDAKSSLADLGDTAEQVFEKFNKMGDAEKRASLAGLKDEADAARKAYSKLKLEIYKKADNRLGAGSGFEGLITPEAVGETRRALEIIRSEVNRSTPDIERMAEALTMPGVDLKIQRQFTDLIAEMEKSGKGMHELDRRAGELERSLKKSADAARDQNVELNKTRTPKEWRNQVKVQENLAKAIEKTRNERIKDAEAAEKAAAALRRSGQDLAQSAKDKAAEMRSRHLSEEERQAKAVQDAHFALNRARAAGIEARLAEQRGDSQALDKALQDAESLLQSAMNHASRGDNANLIEQIGREQQKNKDSQADREDSKAKDATADALAETLKLQQAIEELNKLKNDPIAFTMEGGAEAISEIEAITAALEAMPDDKTITVTTNYVSNGQPPPLGDNAPGFASGGVLPGHSPRDKADNLLFWGTAGEYVVRRAVTRQAGALAFLRQFNRLGMKALSGNNRQGLAARSLRSHVKGARREPCVVPGASSSPLSKGCGGIAAGGLNSLLAAKRLIPPRVSIPAELLDALPRFADGGLLPSVAPAPAAPNLSPTILNFPGIGEYPAQMAVDVQDELIKALKREALKRGRR